SAALGAQALFAAIGAMPPDVPMVRVLLLIIVYIPLVAMLVACVTGRAVRLIAGVFAVVYLIALAAWPFIVNAETSAQTGQPWIFFLVNVGVVAAMLAFPVRVQFIWVLGMPLIYGYVRLVEGEFTGTFWTTTAFD